MSDVTRILDRIQAGEPKAAEELLPLVYDELLAVHDGLEQLAQRDPALERQREIFLKALEKPSPAERAAYLDGACADGPSQHRQGARCRCDRRG